MNTIDVKKKEFVNDKMYYGIIVDDEEVLNMEVSINDGAATIKYDGNMKVFRGLTGALLLKEVLSYVLFNVENVIEAKSYFGSNDDFLCSYSKQFKYQVDVLEDGIICCFIKK